MSLRFYRQQFFLACSFIASSLFGTAVQAQTRFTIAFGSCSRQSAPEQMWGDVLNQKPNLWMWIGDNIYADTHDMDSMKLMYDVQKNHPDYQKMLKSMSIIGTWDDHDYGANDGGKAFSKKDESKGRLLDFLDVPPEAEVRKHNGVYQSFTYGSGKKKVKVILLDTRYFRDTLARSTEKWETVRNQHGWRYSG